MQVIISTLILLYYLNYHQEKLFILYLLKLEFSHSCLQHSLFLNCCNQLPRLYYPILRNNLYLLIHLVHMHDNFAVLYHKRYYNNLVCNLRNFYKTIQTNQVDRFHLILHNNMFLNHLLNMLPKNKCLHQDILNTFYMKLEG